MPQPQPVVVPHAPVIPGLAFRRFGRAALLGQAQHVDRKPVDL